MKLRLPLLVACVVGSEAIGLSTAVGGWYASAHHSHTISNVIVAGALLSIALGMFIWLVGVLVFWMES